MFCSKCGANLPEGSNVCSNCGAALDVGFQVDLSEANISTVEVQQPMEKGKMLSKSKFISQIAEKKTKTFSIVSLILTFVMIASLVFSGYSAVSTSIEKTPIGSVLFLLSGADSSNVDELKEQIAVGIDEAKEQLEEHEDEFDAKELKVLEDTIEILEDCTERISIQNIYNISKNIAKFQELAMGSDTGNSVVGSAAVVAADADVEDATTFVSPSAFGVPASVVGIISIVYYFVLGCFVFALIFSIFGGFFKRTGLIITGMIFAIIFSLIFSGIIATFITTLVHSLLIGFTASVNGKYKEYKRSF